MENHPVPLALVELSNWYYSVLDLGTEGDEDQPDSYWSSLEGVKDVLVRAFASSDCGDFAVMLHQMTGYPVVNLMGPDGLPVHSFVRAPDGQALDIHGLRSDLEVARSYGFKGKAPVTMEVDPHQACGYLESDEWNDEGLDERAERLATIIRQLPWAPFNTPAFQALSCRPLEGVDMPVLQDSEPAPVAPRRPRP